jgi:hypothetical protein
MSSMDRSILVFVIGALLALVPPSSAQSPREWCRRFQEDREALGRFYPITRSTARMDRMTRFLAEWGGRLESLDFDALTRSEQVDFLLLRGEIAGQQADLALERRRLDEIAPLVPFLSGVFALEEARSRLDPTDPPEAANLLDALAVEVEHILKLIKEKDPKPTPVQALRAASAIGEARESITTWSRNLTTYKPAFSWWTDKPRQRLDAALEAYGKHLREEVAGQAGKDDDPLVGDPIGAEALLAELERECIPYTPEELVLIGEREFAWCDEELARAATDLGLAGTAEAIEHVKGLHVPPGEQDRLVIALAREAIDFLDARDLVTIEPLCRETWRIEMLSERRQRVLPFAAYGGQKMLVAYPTEDMDHERKVMTMRGNNRPFTRIVTPHELIPGHHLQGYMAQRYATHRRPFSTPFLVEGWALHWEMLLWDQDWAQGPEDRIGMLFWRRHRCARIIVSLNFHLGRMTPAEMIDFLVERVGLEKDGATAEVRRYVGDGYSPLYQCGYMIGGLQLRALYAALVTRGDLSPKAFHDAVLREGPIPIAHMRAALTDVHLTRTGAAPWRFAGDPK